MDTLAAAYDSVLTNILVTLLSVRHFIRRARPSDAWFDKECRDAKRLTRTLQRRYSSQCRMSDSSRAALAREAWYHQRRLYRLLRHRKASNFWRSPIESERSDPKTTGRSVDRLLCRGRLAASTSISANEYCHYFANKVEMVRRAAADSPSPTFTRITIIIVVAVYI